MKKVRVGLILGPADDQGAGTANYARHLVAHRCTKEEFKTTSNSSFT